MRWSEIVSEDNTQSFDGVFDYLKKEIERGGMAVSENSSDYIADYFKDKPDQLAAFNAAKPQGSGSYKWFAQQFKAKFGIGIMDLAMQSDQINTEKAGEGQPGQYIMRAIGEKMGVKISRQWAVDNLKFYTNAGKVIIVDTGFEFPSAVFDKAAMAEVNHDLSSFPHWLHNNGIRRMDKPARRKPTPPQYD